MKIAIYGGTFDPIHHGHLILAREALEKLQLDKVVFVPAAISPFKKTAALASGELRLKAKPGSQRMTANCVARGPPTPSIQWKRSSDKMPSHKFTA